MSKANPLVDKTLAQLRKMEKDKTASRKKHQAAATKLGKEIAAIKREIENAELKEKIAELEKAAASKAPAAKK